MRVRARVRVRRLQARQHRRLDALKVENLGRVRVRVRARARDRVRVRARVRVRGRGRRRGRGRVRLGVRAQLVDHTSCMKA